MKDIYITKRNGEKELFDIDKFTRSLIRSGATKKDAEHVITLMQDKIVDGMSTHKLYQRAYSLLRKKSGKVAGRYRLKKAILDMGPTGYPFEKLICEMFKLMGYSATSGLVIDGQCVSHEVDVLAIKGNKTVFTECKFHNDVRRKSDVKTSLYVNSRFHDLKNKFRQSDNGDQIYEGWLVTNTRFTNDAEQFGTCAGLKLVSWDFPAKGNLKQIIDQKGMHPITSLHSLTKRDKEALMDKEIVLCRQLRDNVQVLKNMGMTERKIGKIIEEAAQITMYSTD